MPATLHVVNQAGDAAQLLHPDRQRLLEALETPDSASGLARRLGLSRQIVNYHLRELERAGLITLAAERRRGNCIERVMERAASAYMIDPGVLGTLNADPETLADKLSAAYLMAVAARAIKDVSHMSRAAKEADKTLPTLTMETEIRFRSAAERSAFVRELTAGITSLISKYHASTEPQGRSFRLLIASYPARGRKEKTHGE